jgi:hypothetical protein
MPDPDGMLPEHTFSEWSMRYVTGKQKAGDRCDGSGGAPESTYLFVTNHESVIAMWRRDGTPVEVECGTYFGGEKQLCESCMIVAEHYYPQGWRGYPGDTCKHGTYVGGCGADYMCGACEMGDEEQPEFVALEA